MLFRMNSYANLEKYMLDISIPDNALASLDDFPIGSEFYLYYESLNSSYGPYIVLSEPVKYRNHPKIDNTKLPPILSDELVIEIKDGQNGGTSLIFMHVWNMVISATYSKNSSCVFRTKEEADAHLEQEKLLRFIKGKS